jgi:hypothetical protein
MGDRLAMAKQGHHYTETDTGLSFSWPWGGERDVVEIPDEKRSRRLQRRILEGTIVEVDLPVTASPDQYPGFTGGGRILTREEAKRALEETPEGPIKFGTVKVGPVGERGVHVETHRGGPAIKVGGDEAEKNEDKAPSNDGAEGDQPAQTGQEDEDVKQVPEALRPEESLANDNDVKGVKDRAKAVEKRQSQATSTPAEVSTAPVAEPKGDDKTEVKSASEAKADEKADDKKAAGDKKSSKDAG